VIAYHGTPLGGPRQDVARFMHGRHAMVPFPRQEDLGAVAECAESFVFDNGAFSVWKSGAVLDVDGYTRWCEDWARHPGLDWCLIPDVIDGDERDNDVLLSAWPSSIPGVPIWHLHESLHRLDRLAHEWHRVALGSSGQYATPGSEQWTDRMAEAMRTICDSDGKPCCRLHGLRMLAPAIVQRYPFASADSTNVAQNSNSSRAYTPPTKWQRAVNLAWRLEHNSPATWSGRDEQYSLWT
jgi:hypothetical protein